MTGSSPHLQAGAIIGGRYRLVRYLAAGGMGTVFEAQHTLVKRRVAIKLLHPELASKRESLERFEREAQAAGAVESENVAAALDFGIAENGSPYLVLEFLSGESLRSLVERCGRVPLSRATDIVVQACRGVGAAHKAGIVHRDLNPQNIFVCRRDDGTDLVKVLDFGIAKLESSRNTETHTGTILGTPAYLSPEQARGEKTVDQRADVYGLGAVLYEMLAGEKPHPGDSHNATLHHICTQPALALDGERLGLPAELVSVVMAALSSNPSERPASTEELAQKLLPWAKREVWPVPPPVERTDAETSSPPGTLEPPTHPRRRGLTIGLVLVVAVVAAAMAVAGVFVRRQKTTVANQSRSFPHGARLFVPPPNPGAVEQIAVLAKSGAAREAAAITAMASVPQAIWFSKGTPEEAQGSVSNAMVRAAQDRALRVLVASNRPYRDCAGFSAGGAKNTAAYETWIDAFARGIGNERAIVILEPDCMGMIPFISNLEGVAEPCRPTVTDANGKPVPAPEATAEDTFAQIRYAVGSLTRNAPNALVYLDGTHPGWLRVSDVAYRLYRSGIQQTQGFAVNVSNFQTTPKSIRYGTWIAKCLTYATTIASDAGTPAAFRRCANQPSADHPANVRGDDAEWVAVDAWYAANVPAKLDGLAHFVIDTSRNGRGALDVARYAEPPYNQPESVIHGLSIGAWCTPPDTGLGLRPTTETGVPLLDAYLWIKTVGESDGSCDIAGGTRAWDYERYNPWGITGESQKHFDPLWGMVDPAAGTWFPAHALDLAEKAEPTLLP